MIISPLRLFRENCTPDKIGGMKYMMSPKELGRLSLTQGAIDKVYTVRDVAKRLGVSERRVKHGNAGKHPATYTPMRACEKE